MARRNGHDGYTLAGEERIGRREGLLDVLVAWDGWSKPGKPPGHEVGGGCFIWVDVAWMPLMQI